ncbi:PA14 domain-containing protein [Flammeovirgaceae bacterium SG7u.111]|nr:PA14 domain-containing protein [Flammeovirgaceae bacterium SG7u.132]WPO33242.1 PA14 domain-containing protein [Flammeovirgaceae bacterium SG7u.111]
MKKTLLFLFFLLLGKVYAQDAIFKSEVETAKKPWTNTQFYNNPANFQFAIVSDRTGGARPGIFEKGIDKLNLMMPEFVVSVGDLIQGYTQDSTQINKEWEEMNGIIGRLKVPFFYLPGNHDISNKTMQLEWEKRYGRRFYSFTYKDVLFVIMDSNDDDDFNISEEQRDYVLNTIAENKDAKWTFLLVHHPIWNYDTKGRFKEIEDAIADRKYTVLAGHTHHYLHEKRLNHNYYVLGTTGGGSALRGHRFGEYDHITWVTMADEGPVMANLKLDGVLDHDISNAETRKLADAMLENTSFEHLLLTNEGEAFEEGTLYLKFKNKSENKLLIDLSFFHQHKFEISPSKSTIELEPSSEKTFEITLASSTPLSQDEKALLQFHWEMKFEREDYSDLKLEGDKVIKLEASEPDYFFPTTDLFADNQEISINNPFDEAKVFYSVNSESVDKPYNGSAIPIDETSSVGFQLKNGKGQVSKAFFKDYKKATYLKAVKKKKNIKGLSYKYYEGMWGEDSIPNFENLKVVKEGVAKDFDVRLIADRSDEFGLVLEGYIEVPADALYQFRCRADEFGKFYVHDQLISDDHYRAIPGSIALKKGLHPIKIEFVETDGNQKLRLDYRLADDQRWESVDFNMLFIK